MVQRNVLRNMPTTLEFERFWHWLQSHHNCIVRAGTPEIVLYDDEDYHWHMWRPDADSYVIELLRGKRMVASVHVDPSEITYVEAIPEEDEVIFECVSEAHAERYVPYFFVMAHGLDEEAQPDPVIN